MLVALLAVSATLTVGTGVFASSATQTALTTTKPATLTKEFRNQTGSVAKTDRLAQLSSQLSLTAAQKTQFDKLIAQLQTERKAYHDQKAAATTQEAKDKLKTQREQRKTELKNQILALVPADQKTQVESLLSKSKGKKGGKSDFTEGSQKRGGLGFLWSFVDESKLSEAQKTEIQTLQQQKHEQMKTLLQQLRTATTDAQKTELESKLQKVNQDFLTALKKYIPSDKLAAYEQFVTEAKTWTKKSEKRAARSSTSLSSQTSSTNITTMTKSSS